MIATGGLLRITARRQDSLKSKPHKAHKNKKSKQKRRTEVVVVKGKLKLISVSGLVAAVGVLVLLVGMVMVALGYWPRDGLFFKTPTREGTTMDSIDSTPETTETQEREDTSQPDEDGGWSHEGVNGTSQQRHPGFLNDLLYRYLYSDRLKVVGPLIMGIGIFLFICANAVLHENRDKKTKVINLRDIYSTVIDLHSHHKHGNASSNPLNGLVNYVQSKSLESKSWCYPPFLMNRGEGKGGGEGGSGQQPVPDGSTGGGGNDTEGGVFTIYQNKPTDPTPSSSPFVLSPGISSISWTSMFNLPLCPTQPLAPWRRHSAREGVALGGDTNGRVEKKGDMNGRGGGEVHNQEQEEGVTFYLPSLCSSNFRPSVMSCSFSSLHMEAPGGSQALLLSSPITPSHLSLTPNRRCSLPTISGVSGHSEVMWSHRNSGDTAEMTSSHHMTSHL